MYLWDQHWSQYADLDMARSLKFRMLESWSSMWLWGGHRPIRAAVYREGISSLEVLPSEGTDAVLKGPCLVLMKRLLQKCETGPSVASLLLVSPPCTLCYGAREPFLAAESRRLFVLKLSASKNYDLNKPFSFCKSASLSYVIITMELTMENWQLSKEDPLSLSVWTSTSSI